MIELPKHTLLTRRLETQLARELPEITPYSWSGQKGRSAPKITGPFITQTDIESPFYHEMKVSYRQRRPYNTNLPHFLNKGAALGPGNNQRRKGSEWRAHGELAEDDPLTVRAYAAAYSKLVDQLGEPAGIGITLAQWKQAEGMVTARVKQLTRFTRAVIRRDPIGAWRELGFSVRKDEIAWWRRRHGLSYKLSDLWLEFWFGWKPAVQDIYTACEVFDRPLPMRFYKGARTMTDYNRVMQTGEEQFSRRLVFTEVKSRVSLGVPIRIANANMYLMNQFGILNAGLIAYDAIPWSFVADWVWNVSSWLGSFTDLAGLEAGMGYKSVKTTVRGMESWKAYPEKDGAGIGLCKRRTLVDGLAGPGLYLKQFKVSPTRAMTAIALLMQQMNRITRD